MDPRVVAIHQPNFLPWLGYFDKIARADVFVVLDDVQFPKRRDLGQSRAPARQRRAVLGDDPVVRSYHGTRTIREMEIDESKPWRRTLLRTVEQATGRTRARRAPWSRSWSGTRPRTWPRTTWPRSGALRATRPRC